MILEDVTLADVLTKVYDLVSYCRDCVMPKSKEARLRLNFFIDSLFMDMPSATLIHDIFSWKLVKLYLSEVVIFTKADLEQRTDELGVSTLLYMQISFRID